MANTKSISTEDAIYKLQLSMIDGITSEDQLFAVGTLLSRTDYEDIVTERSITRICGYPLCKNGLPSERPRKGRYQISLKEHKVYDLEETYKYCSSSCLVNSRAFAISLPDERGLDLKSSKLEEIVRLFGNLGLESAEQDVRKKGDLGSSSLKIQEKTDTQVGRMSLEEWIGPSNAIEGYVPQYEASSSKNLKREIDPKRTEPLKKNDFIVSETDFTSTIITSNEYSISKKSADTTDSGSLKKLEPKGIRKHKDVKLKKDSGKGSRKVKGEKKSEHISQNVCSSSNSLKHDSNHEKLATVDEAVVKPSLKSSITKSKSRSVSWADEKAIDSGRGNLCEVREIEETVSETPRSDIACLEDDNDTARFASAEACAMALSKAAEAAASGYSDIPVAVSEAGIIILPSPHESDREEPLDDTDIYQRKPDILKLTRKQEIPHSDIFESDDSCFDSAPEGFSLTLSPFATMWNALFGWITSSSLAYIYGRDECSHEDFLSVNGVEYPRKIVLNSCPSEEIKLTLNGILNRALSGIVTDLRLPIHAIEKEMGAMLDTMSFTESLPAFSSKQWQVIVLLFIEAVSVYRNPQLNSSTANSRIVLNKVLDGAQIGREEYELMKNLIIPLGRVPPNSSMQNGA